MIRRRRQAGFTLIELMVALVVGIIAITTIYFVGSASAHHFQEQQRIAQTQMSVRMAMEQLRRDIERAGYLGTPNSTREQTCLNAGGPRVQAVEFQDNVDTGVLPNAAQNGATADRLRLVGNYATGDSYLAAGLNNVGSALFLQQSWQAFRRDFMVDDGAGNLTPDNQRFQDVFRPGRMLHIQTMQGQHFFVTIQGTPAFGQISFSPTIGIGGACVNGLADGAIVSPLVRIEYRVQDLTAGAQGSSLLPAGGAPVAANQSFRGEANAQLVRSEMSFGNNPAVVTNAAGDSFERIVLEYVADVDYQFVVDTQTGTGLPPNLVRQSGAVAAATLQDLNANLAARPDQVRSVIVTLAAHTAEQDPRFPWVNGAAGNPVTGVAPTRYRVNPGYAGAARVRALRTEIFLPNVANQ